MSSLTPDQRSATPEAQSPQLDEMQAQTAQMKKTATAVKQSSKAVEHSTKQATESADQRTTLAADRTIFAAERTYAAWVRTGLAALASGVGARAVLEGIVAEWLIMITATVLVFLSAFCFVAAIWRYLRPGAPLNIPSIRRLPAVMLIGVNIFLMLVAMAALYGIWHGDFSPQ